MRDRILSHADTSATLEIDLKPYLSAHHQFKAHKITELTHEIKNINSQILWQNLFNQACSKLNQPTKNELISSPAYVFMQQHFNELLNNAIDSVLAAHVPKLHLKLTIHDDPRYNLATFKLADNGSGFEPDFLETIKTKRTRENTHYYQQQGSDKQGEKDNLVIGGAGKGLQQLVALADHGEKVIGPIKREPCYEVPRISALNFSNKTAPKHGAIILLTTSKAALVPIHRQTHHELFEPPETHPKNLRNRRGLEDLNIDIPKIDEENNDENPSV